MPKDWIASGVWPHSGIWKEGAPPSAKLAQGLAARLCEALKYDKKLDPERISARKAAAAAGLAPATVTAILNGTVWPDIDTICRLEHSLDTELWGDEHRPTDSDLQKDEPEGRYREYGEDSPDSDLQEGGPEGRYRENGEDPPDSDDFTFVVESLEDGFDEGDYLDEFPP